MTDRRSVLAQMAATVTAAAAAAPYVRAEVTSSPPKSAEAGSSRPLRAQTFREYLEKSAVPKDAIDQFVRGPSWAKFDPELGYVLSNSLQADGIDHSSTFSTVQANGARTAFMYANRKPRINTYGDSFTQCHQVSDGETWQERLAAHLGEPIANFGVGGFGVYQAYRRLIREERTDHAAKYLVFYIWGDDHIRSLYRARWAAIYPWFGMQQVRKVQGVGFHANFWSNVEMDLDTGLFVERKQLLPTSNSLYHMCDPQWMADHLEDDLALQLAAYSGGVIQELHREKVTKLAARLSFSFDWDLLSRRDTVPNLVPGLPAMTRMQAHAAALLDKYSLRATQFILDKVCSFASQNDRELLLVLFDHSRAMPEMRLRGTRYDREIVDYLLAKRVTFFDMNDIHLLDFQKYNLNWEDYMKQYFIGHYNPAGNGFFAYSIKDKVASWLDPKPVPYQNPNQQSVNFGGYIKGYQ